MVEFSPKSNVMATPEEIFALVGEFKDLANLLPSVTNVRVFEENGQTFRTFLNNGTPAKEVLLARGSAGYTYGVVAPGPPIQSGTLTVGLNDGGPTLEWSARLEPGTPTDVAPRIFAVFNDGITNVSDQFNK